MGLFAPAWMSNKRDKALAAVEKLTDPSQIAEAAKKAPLVDTRIAAIRKLSGQRAALVEIAQTAPSIEEQEQAVVTMSSLNQEDLKLIALHHQVESVRLRAISNIWEPEILNELLRAYNDETQLLVLIEAVVDRFTLSEELMELARQEGIRSFSCTASFAARRIKDQASLAELITTTTGPWIAAAALVNYLEQPFDEVFLAEIAKRPAYLPNMMNDEFSACDEVNFKSLAVCRLNDSKLLADVGMNADFEEARRLAERRISGRIRLYTAAHPYDAGVHDISSDLYAITRRAGWDDSEIWAAQYAEKLTAAITQGKGHLAVYRELPEKKSVGLHEKQAAKRIADTIRAHPQKIRKAFSPVWEELCFMLTKPTEKEIIRSDAFISLTDSWEIHENEFEYGLTFGQYAEFPEITEIPHSETDAWPIEESICLVCGQAFTGQPSFYHGRAFDICQDCMDSSSNLHEENGHYILLADDDRGDTKTCLLCGKQQRFTLEGDFEGTRFHVTPCV